MWLTVFKFREYEQCVRFFKKTTFIPKNRLYFLTEIENIRTKLFYEFFAILTAVFARTCCASITRSDI